MLLNRRLYLIGSLVVMAAAVLSAFKPDVHVEVTERALASFTEGASRLQVPLTKQTPVYWREMIRKGFTFDATTEITNANKVKDTGDCAEDRPDVAAEPCTKFLSESIAAYDFLSEQPAPDHFDAEEIQEGSNRVFRAKDTIRGYLLARRYVAARKALGATLHSIQDFYAHTNWVNLNKRELDGRLGRALNSYVGTIPRIADKGDPTCKDGMYLLTDLGFADRVEFTDQFSKVRLGADALLTKAYADPPLTSGYFSKLDNSLPDVADGFKCRHGYNATPGLDNRGFQPGIAKDSRTRTIDTAFDNAFEMGIAHSNNFIVGLFDDARMRPEMVTHILGLMGYESRVSGFVISEVPRPQGQDLWDGVIESFLAFWKVHPDIETCVTTGNDRRCAPVCEDADSGSPTRSCIQSFPDNGFWLPASGDIAVEVWDIDPTGRQLMARGNIPVSDKCLALDPRSRRPPCEITTPDRGKLTILFDIPGSCVPVIDRDCISPSAPSATPPAPGGSAARTPESIDAALRLRDADNCVGGDAFFPAGTALDTSAIGRRLGPDQTNRLYQAAALAMVVADPTAKGNILAAINSRVRSDDFLDVMTSVMTNPVQAPAIASGYTGAAKYVAGQVVATGLDKLLTRPAADLSPDVGRWIVKRLATAPLASEAVDRILTSPTPVSAECTINELAKGGFTDVVNGL